MSRAARLSTTSHIVLGLLCVRPWSGYELAQQLERGWQDLWPRAARGIYNEPKKLVAHGLATRWTERTGRRQRTVYEANDRGREAFDDWVGRTSQPPAFESEALVRVAFADRGSIEQLRGAIDQIRAHAHARSDDLLTQGTDYLRTGGPFPDRLHLLHLVGGYLAEHHAAMLRWADWAEAAIADWETVGEASDTPNLDELAEHVARLLAQNLQAVGEGTPPPSSPMAQRSEGGTSTVDTTGT